MHPKEPTKNNVATILASKNVGNEYLHTACIHLDVGLSVDVFEEFFEEPEAALEDAEEDLGDPASLVLEFPLQVGQDYPDHLDDGYDEGPECQRPRVESGGIGNRKMNDASSCMNCK